MKIPWSNPLHPPPAPPGSGRQGTTGSKCFVSLRICVLWLSRLTFHWLSAFLDVGFSRPLEKEDFWELPPSRHASALTDAMERNFYMRCPPEKRPLFMRNAAANDSEVTAIVTEANINEKMEYVPGPEASSTTASTYDESLFKALYQTFKRRIWGSGILLLVSDTIRTTSPLVNKVFITWLTDSYVYFRLTESERALAATQGFTKPRGIGYGIGLAFAIYVIGNIFRKSLRLSGRSRAEHSVGKITTMISTDATRIDGIAYLGHYLWEAPIQVLIVGMPIQFILVTIMFNQRKKCVKITDRRVRLTTEVLQGIRLIKAYGWEAFYSRQITNLRVQEVARIRKSSIAAALLIATFYFLPVISSVIAFITYSLTGHDLSIAKVFTALQLFNVMRAPLLLFPLVLSSLADAMVSFGRLCDFLTAEELAETYLIDHSQPLALHVDGDFEWETSLKLQATSEDSDKLMNCKASQGIGKKGGRQEEVKEGHEKEALPFTTSDVTPDKEDKDDEKPFALKDLRLDVQKGTFVAIVGRVGSGKSSILQALIGEMRRTRGKVVFNDRMAYFPQSPWIKNATVRENILFGQEYNEKKFHEVIQACSLEHDLEMLPHGENTEIGEKGINLSARAAYSLSEIVLLDDPLSAVDAHVGKHVLENCLLHGPLARRTRILVTHSLQILDKTDYIYVMSDGKIVEEGTYNDLYSSGAALSRLIEEHGHGESGKQTNTRNGPLHGPITKKGSDATEAALMQEEERNVGAVTWSVYKKYLENAGGLIWAPVIAALLITVEGNNGSHSNVLASFYNVILGFWSGNTLKNFTQGEYMGVYGALGMLNGITSRKIRLTFPGAALACLIIQWHLRMAGLIAGLNLYRAALSGVLNSRVSFFDTTPIGSLATSWLILLDQDTIDSALPHMLMQFLTTFFSVIGTVGLVFYTFPYLGIIFLPLGVLYYGASIYYRRSSVETKRLDSLMRSILYGSYSETLTGLPTVRAYGMQACLVFSRERAVQDAEHGLDMENRAYMMTVISVVLSYTLGAEMISFFAQSEQNMNAVERVLHYVELSPEIDDSVASIEPTESWPTHGAISFQDVKLTYREGLPLVLKGISFDIKAGEKIGIVGRTGSGKSSIIQALLRLVEPQNGIIEIDDLDISAIGLNGLRTRIAFVPQDTTLFLGTLRDNLDPEKLRTDAELISILQQAWLLPKDGPVDPAVEAKFSLDSTVGDEGSNYSAGEKQLLALCRALVKKSRIIILANSRIQQTIQAEFANSTLLCIAHRLNTIVHYDRILVMDDGNVAEFDSVLALFDRTDSLFRSLWRRPLVREHHIFVIASMDGAHTNERRSSGPYILIYPEGSYPSSLG
ncbi:multidrug resistance-associated ABC transporter [Pholiota molesta]|nr:multidrug resistance-associated ABC transporter [Pholiota molesta]